MGVIPKFNLYHVIRKQKTMKDIILDTPYGIKIVAGASGFSRIANLSEEERRGFVSELTALADADIIINTTSVGMYPYTSETLVPDARVFHTGQLAYDLIYNPGTTRFLHDARRQGADIQNGLDMLIYQGVCSLQIWQDGEQRKSIPVSTPGYCSHK